MEHVAAVVAWSLAVLIGVLIGYLTGYAKKKGENRAIHEDINKLVEQVRVVTTTTKEIEAKISGELWDRQKRWELKRDLLLDGIKATQTVVDKAVKFYATSETVNQQPEQNTPAQLGMVLEVSTALWDAMNDFERASLLIELVCGQELKKALSDFNLFVRDLVNVINHGDVAVASHMVRQFSTKRDSALTTIREELSPRAPAASPEQQ
jgi:hypothetical protein